MPAFKSDIYITITTGGKSFRIGGVRLPNNAKVSGRPHYETEKE